jgi:hypothetical protein
MPTQLHGRGPFFRVEADSAVVPIDLNITHGARAMAARMFPTSANPPVWRKSAPTAICSIPALMFARRISRRTLKRSRRKCRFAKRTILKKQVNANPERMKYGGSKSHRLHQNRLHQNRLQHQRCAIPQPRATPWVRIVRIFSPEGAAQTLFRPFSARVFFGRPIRGVALR